MLHYHYSCKFQCLLFLSWTCLWDFCFISGLCTSLCEFPILWSWSRNSRWRWGNKQNYNHNFHFMV